MNDEPAPASRCALRLGGDVLSAWRDTELRGTQARRVEAHVVGCAHCQVRLSAFETLGALLRTQPIPEPRPNALIELNARLSARQSRWRASAGHPYASAIPHPGSWRGLLALIVVLLLAALCARLLITGLRTIGGRPTPHLAPYAIAAAMMPAATTKEALWQAKTS